MNIIAKIYKLIFNYNNKALSNEAVNEFYADIKTPEQLLIKLKSYGYTWKGEYYLSDWNKTPNEALAVKELNCGDFMNLFVELYNRLGLLHNTYYFENWDNIFNPNWHYVSVFKLNGLWYCQSNLNIDHVVNASEVIAKYENQNFKLKGQGI